MSAVLEFRQPAVGRAQRRGGEGGQCEIVIFPGVRIEREAPAKLDLAHRLRASLAAEDFDGSGRPRKTS